MKIEFRKQVGEPPYDKKDQWCLIEDGLLMSTFDTEARVVHQL